MHKAFGGLNDDQAQAPYDELVEWLARSNRAGNTSLVIPSGYLEIVVHRA
jgi:hypothetical protein